MAVRVFVNSANCGLAGVNSNPERVAKRPVNRAARDGAQEAFPAYPFGKCIPCAAIESMLGVGTLPPAIPPP